ncbi:MAG TPA: hypothetical protein VI729_10660 [Anaerolineales bacterium]|nr:hypothetical protein [Anaerolineales bacterium]
MTSPLRWPNVHKEARDQAAEAAVKIIFALTPAVEGKKMSELERTRRESIALTNAHRIARLMSDAGAPIRAIDEL